MFTMWETKMKNKELEIIKAFAELDDVDIQQPYGDKFYIGVGSTLYEYNPLLPNALNCEARDKYRLEADFEKNAWFIYGTEMNRFDFVSVDFNGDIPKAAIECILKSQEALL